MAMKEYKGLFNLHTLCPAIEAAAPKAKLYLRQGPFEAATKIEVDAIPLSPTRLRVNLAVSAHNPTVKSQEQNDLITGLAKLKALGFTDGELTTLGIMAILIKE